MNLSKFNHILIPGTKEERDRFRETRRWWFFQMVYRVYMAFSSEGRALAFAWMLMSLSSMNVAYNRFYIAWSVVTGLLVGAVLIRGWLDLSDVHLQVTGPARVTVGEEMQLTLAFHNRGDTLHQALRIQGPFLPWDGKYLVSSPVIKELPPGSRCERSVKMRFVARGEHHLDEFEARALAPMGLTQGRAVYSEGFRFLVIPQIANVRDVQVDMTEKYQPGGIALASITGESRELIGVRPYRPGDPIRDLHPKTWARVGYPVVREYQQEYFTRVGVVIDTDGGEADEPPLEGMLSLAAGIVAQLSRGEALLDLLLVGEELHQLTLGRSLGFLEQALDVLACVNPKDGFRPEQLQQQLQAHMSRLSCMIFVSLRWDEGREQFVDWVEQQGVRCRKLHVYDKEASPAAQRSGAMALPAADILAGKELRV